MDQDLTSGNDDELFTDEPASVSDISERWSLASHQIYYLVKSRRIPHVRMIGTTKLFDVTQQRRLYSIFHKLDDANEIELKARSPKIEQEICEAQEGMQAEQERMQAEQERIQAEIDELKAQMTLVLRTLAQQGQEKPA